MGDELIRLSACEAVDRLRTGEIRPSELVEAALARIAQVEPDTHALPILCAERAREHARRIERTRSTEPLPRGWLGGLPVAVKDLIDVAGVATTYGSPLFRDNVPTRSHPLVERIERLGGIVIGKSNMPEFGIGGNTSNPLFGQTLNPFADGLTPGGSSGGSAAALSAGEVWLAHGTDHGGSLRRPAAFCGVTGLRPSPGRVTRGTPKNLFGPHVVHGPMARSVADLALFLDTMTGLCRADPLTFDAPAESFSDAIRAPWQPLRVAYTGDFGGRLAVERDNRERCARAVRRFELMGCVVEACSPDIGEAADAFLALRWQHALIDRQHLLERFGTRLPQALRWNLENALAQTPARLAWAERERSALYARLARFFEEWDLLVTPVAASPPWQLALGPPTHIDGAPADHPAAAQAINSIITLSGLPCLALACDRDDLDRPIGLQLVGPPRGEALLLRAAHAFEQVTGPMIRPAWPRVPS